MKIKTVYRVAKLNEYPAIYGRFDITCRLTWPVIVAIRNGILIAVLGTHGDDRLIAGPLITSIPGKVNIGFVVFRIIEYYEEYLRAIGMRQFYFYVEKGLNDHFIKIIERLGSCSFYHENEGFVWYKRLLEA